MTGQHKTCRGPVRRGPTTLEAIVTDYLREYGRCRDWIGFHQSQRSLPEALDAVATWRDRSGKVYSHQSRVPRAAKKRAGAAIRALELEGVGTFADLLDRVEEAIGEIRGIGDLTVYDVATRIGAHLRVWPERVYVHAGVRKGVRALHLDPRPRSLPIEDLPPALRRLEPWQVEDVLCIYSDEIKAAVNRLDS